MSMDETVMSEDGTEVAAGYEPEHAFDAAPTPTPLPTQVTQPLQAALRTLVAAVVGALVAYLARLIGGQDSSPELVSAIGVVVTTIVTRVMAIPDVNDALTRFGLGATPKG